MIYEFRTKASGSVIMTAPVAQMVFDAMGKELSPKGIITVEQLPAMLENLKAAVAREKEASRGQPVPDDEQAANRPISLGVRAYAFLEMLEAAARKQKEIVWGV